MAKLDAKRKNNNAQAQVAAHGSQDFDSENDFISFGGLISQECLLGRMLLEGVFYLCSWLLVITCGLWKWLALKKEKVLMELGYASSSHSKTPCSICGLLRCCLNQIYHRQRETDIKQHFI